MASTLDRQVGRVRLRMFLGSLLASVAWSWVAALAVAVCWFLSQPYLWSDAPSWLARSSLPWREAGWQPWLSLSAVLAGLGGVATLVAIVLTALRAPTPVAAALSLDERFALKERVTTSITLAPDEAASPAGQALLADVEQRLGKVRIGDRFPIGLPWKPAALLPGALAILCVVFFWNPRVDASRSGDEGDYANPVVKEDLDQHMKQLAVKKREKKAEDPAKASDLVRIDEDIDKFTRRPRETRDDIRDRIKDATELEEAIRRQQKEQAERIEAFKEQMKQTERLRRKNRGENKDNPGKKAADALARGDMDKAREEFQRLADEMKKEEEEKERLRRKKRDAKTDEERKKAEEELEKLERASKLTRKDKEDLQKQVKDLQDQLERLTRDKEEIAEDLEDMADRGEIDEEELDRELEKLDKNAEKLTPEELKELAEAMKECKECMEKGDEEGAAKALEKAARAAGKMGKGGEGQDLQQKLVQIRKVKKALCRALGKKPGGQGGGPRPESPDKGDTGTEVKYNPGQWNKGKREVVGDGPMGGFKGPRKPSEMVEEIRQAAQEAPAAIDRQRLPPSARKMARGYFEKVRGPDKVAPKKDTKKP